MCPDVGCGCLNLSQIIETGDTGSGVTWSSYKGLYKVILFTIKVITDLVRVNQ